MTLEIPSITIGQQVWTDRNLDVTTFRNGDPIFEAKNEQEWRDMSQQNKPVCACLDFDPVNAQYYGRYYNWHAVNDPRGLAPAGWHVPDMNEWRQLTDFLGGELNAGRKIKSTHSWVNRGDGTNESGFNAFPGGGVSGGGYFILKGQMGFWWGTTLDTTQMAYVLILQNISYGAASRFCSLGEGYSIRCVKD